MTRAERIANNDPRLSIEERYGNLWQYYFYATTFASQAVSQRFLLPEDAQRLVNQALNNIIANGILPKRGQFMLK